MGAFKYPRSIFYGNDWLLPTKKVFFQKSEIYDLFKNLLRLMRLLVKDYLTPKGQWLKIASESKTVLEIFPKIQSCAFLESQVYSGK